MTQYDGPGYDATEDAEDLARQLPSLYLDRPADMFYIAEAVLNSDWLQLALGEAWDKGHNATDEPNPYTAVDEWSRAEQWRKASIK